MRTPNQRANFVMRSTTCLHTSLTSYFNFASIVIIFQSTIASIKSSLIFTRTPKPKHGRTSHSALTPHHSRHPLEEDRSILDFILRMPDEHRPSTTYANEKVRHLHYSPLAEALTSARYRSFPTTPWSTDQL